MPRKSTSSMTASFEEFAHALQESTWPTGLEARPVPSIAVRTSLMKLTMVSGPAPMPALFSIPLSDSLYISSLPTLMAMTRSVNLVPNLSTADFSAASSLEIVVVPEHQIPRSMEVLVLMAA